MASIFLVKKDDSQASMYSSNLSQPEAGRAKIELRMSKNNADYGLINHRDFALFLNPSSFPYL